jgi:excisionase family DNA binding protein
MTFEEAAEFLNTPRSTLYRWLREEKVPGHKLGRQWRFLREELDAFLRGEGPHAAAESLKRLADFLRERHAPEDEMNVMDWNSPAEIAEAVLWDAVDAGAATVHLQPDTGGYQLRYRTSDGLQQLVDLDEAAFDALDQQWQDASRAILNDDQRRMSFARPADDTDEPERIQVRYQRLETISGPRVTLRILRESRIKTDISDIAPEAEDSGRLRRWCGAPYGIVLLSGRSGSGKTTTAYSCLAEIAKRDDRVIFTLEDAIGFVMPGINQLELNLDDQAEYRAAFNAIFESDLDVLFIASTFAQRHRHVLWDTARSAAESGHLVFVQMEADSATDAMERFGAAVDLPVDDLVVGACWQELVREDGSIRARYEFVSGPLEPQDD